MPNNKILLITEDYYKKNSVVQLNVEANIQIHIIKAQNLHIERILGTNLFNTIMEQITNNSVEPRMKTLIDGYIQPALVEWTTYVAIPYINYSFTNKSIVKKSSEESEASSLKEINFLRNDIRDDAEYMSNRLSLFLKANDDVYTEFKNGNDDEDDIKSARGGIFFGGIVLKNSGCEYRKYGCDDDADYYYNTKK